MKKLDYDNAKKYYIKAIYHTDSQNDKDVIKQKLLDNLVKSKLK